MQRERVNDGDSITERLTRALERKPAVEAPAGFAARVAQQVPARRAVTLTPARYGRRTMWVGMAVLVLAVMVVATRWTGSRDFGTALEWVLCTELVALAAWLGGVWEPIEG
jgi:hypothetical protein